MRSMADVNGWLMAVQKKIAVVLDALNGKELLVTAFFILFKLAAETVVIPLIIFFEAANRKAVRVYRNGETVQHLVRLVKTPNQSKLAVTLVRKQFYLRLNDKVVAFFNRHFFVVKHPAAGTFVFHPIIAILYKALFILVVNNFPALEAGVEIVAQKGFLVQDIGNGQTINHGCLFLLYKLIGADLKGLEEWK